MKIQKKKIFVHKLKSKQVQNNDGGTSQSNYQLKNNKSCIVGGC